MNDTARKQARTMHTKQTYQKNISAIEGKCKFQGSPKNGYTSNGIFLNGKLFSHGSNVEYACDVKYTMDGTNILHCNDGFWNASIPSCKGMYSFCANTKLTSKLLLSPWKSWWFINVFSLNIAVLFRSHMYWPWVNRQRKTKWYRFFSRTGGHVWMLYKKLQFGWKSSSDM